MAQTTVTHQLSVRVQRPKIALEGKNAKYSYILKNIVLYLFYWNRSDGGFL